jgi:DnaJ-class molecular chaperone
LDNEERNVANWNKREVEKKKAAQPNWYKLLGLKDFGSATTTSDVKKAYKKLALVHHPDKNSAPISTKLFKLVSEASRVLCDDTEREKWWREQRKKTSTASHSSRRTPGSASSKSSSSNASSSRWHSYEI